MNVAILTSREDATIYLERFRNPDTRVIASGVDTFLFLRQQGISYRRLSDFIDLRQTRREWKSAFAISERFCSQLPLQSLGRWEMDFRYPIHQSLKYVLVDIVRSKGIVENLLKTYHPSVIYCSTILSEPLLQKTHNQEFTLFAHVVVALARKQGIEVKILRKGPQRFFLTLWTLIGKVLLELITNSARALVHPRTRERVSAPSRPRLFLSASLHMLLNMAPLVRLLRKRWSVLVVGKLGAAQKPFLPAHTHMTYVRTNTITQSLSFKDLLTALVLSAWMFVRYALLPKKVTREYFRRVLGLDLFHVIDPLLSYYFSVFVSELTKNYLFIREQCSHTPFNIVLASNNMDPFNVALMFFAKKHRIPYALTIHDAQGNTFCDFFFEPTDTLFVWGNFQRCIIKKEFPSLHCIVTGHPDFDSYVSIFRQRPTRPSLIRKKVLKILVLSAYNPFIQHPNQEILYDTIRELDKFARIHRSISVTLKTHPSENYRTFVKMMETVVTYPLRLNQQETDTLLTVHDLVISQSTSAGVRAILRHKPMIYLNIRDFRDYEPYAREGAALGVSSLRDLRPALDRLIRNPLLLANGQDRFIEDFCYRVDGKSSARIVHELDRMLRAKRSTTLREALP